MILTPLSEREPTFSNKVPNQLTKERIMDLINVAASLLGQYGPLLIAMIAMILFALSIASAIWWVKPPMEKLNDSVFGSLPAE